METLFYQVDIDDHDLSGQPCKCEACDWQGVADELADIGDCSLTPGDPSPAGRCPVCDTLAYLSRPIDYARAAGPELLVALETLTKWMTAAGFGNSPRSKQWSMCEAARKAIHNAKPRSTMERCHELVTAYTDKHDPGNAVQIEYEALASKYYDKPEDEVWHELERALKRDA